MEDNQNNPVSPVASNSAHHSDKHPRMAGFFERFLAAIIDGFIVGIASFIAGMIFGVFVALSGGYNADGSASTGTTFLSGLLGMAIGYAYLGYFYTTKGQTLGKMAMKMKVVRSSNLGYMSWGEVALRDILGKWVSTILLYLGYFWYFMSEKRQTWHDMIASTYVVKTDDSGNLLMDGPAEYQKEPVKAFGLCGIIGLMFIAMLALFVYAASLAGEAIYDEIQNKNVNTSEVNIDGKIRMEINGEEVPLDNEEDIQKYFEQNFPENTEGQTNQVN